MPGYEPDFAAAIRQDPGYAALQQSISAAGIANAAQRAAATNRALIQFGVVPDFSSAAGRLGLDPNALGFLNEDVTPDVGALASQNTANGLSTEAQLQQAHQQQVLHLRNTLAARGALSSGEANYQLGNEQTSYAQNEQSAIGKLLDAISGYQGQYLTADQANQQQLASGLGSAESRQAALPQNQPTAAQSFSYDHGSGKYVGPGGTYTPRALGNGQYVVVNDATGETHPLDTATATIGAPTTAAAYFAANPLAQGATTNQALTALSQFAPNPTAAYTPSSVAASSPTVSTTTSPPPAPPTQTATGSPVGVSSNGSSAHSGFNRVPVQ